MSSRKQIAELLAEVPLFARCTKRALATIARHAEVASFEGGQDLVIEGNKGDAFFVLLEGGCTITKGSKKLGDVEPGGYFGELALLDPAPRSATITTTTPSTVAVLGPRMFRTLVREYPDLAEGLLSGLAAQLRAARAN
ncbi:MAG: cyclic nucleotide-binding domain-containing protein [Acidobacteria bacterium]|nr:cyclic nucleotide-binding domain-containing protein [Acidobacteriota bacterium]